MEIFVLRVHVLLLVETMISRSHIGGYGGHVKVFEVSAKCGVMLSCKILGEGVGIHICSLVRWLVLSVGGG